MTFRRRILRYGPSPEEWQGALEDRAIAGCQFELHRCGGCGRGEVRLNDRFDDRVALAVGEWVACEYDDGDRWYLGRIEERRADSPGGISLRLEGMSVQLNEVYPGGFGGEGAQPHRYGHTDLFPGDPDRLLETNDDVLRPEDVVRLLMAQYVVPATDIRVEAGLIEDADVWSEPVNLKFNGEETVRTILKDLALRARNAAWGVDELGQFYLLQARTDILASFREGENLVELREEATRNTLYNRVLLTGGYVYTQPTSDSPLRSAARWRGNYRQPASLEKYGERRLRMWVPWIRTAADSRNFVREFFRVYAEPGRTYHIEAVAQDVCPRPWLGRVQLLDRHDNVLLTAQPETVRVRFDNTPRLSLVLGPDDPRTHWPEPPHDERYPVLPPSVGISSGGGGPITLTLPSDGDDPPPPPGSSDESSTQPTSELLSSDEVTSDGTSSDVLTSGATSSGAASTSASGSGSLSGSLSQTSDSDAETSNETSGDTSDSQSRDTSATDSTSDETTLSGTSASGGEPTSQSGSADPEDSSGGDDESLTTSTESGTHGTDDGTNSIWPSGGTTGDGWTSWGTEDATESSSGSFFTA